MTNMKKQLLLALLMFLPIVASADIIEISGLWYNLIPKGQIAEVSPSQGTPYSGDIIIPETVTYGDVEYNVSSIAERAFYSCLELISITIPNSVNSIGDYAFSGCTSLTSITIPNSVTSIKSGSFQGCTGLTSIIVPNSVTSIGYEVFSGCTGLTSIIIPNSVTSIGSSAFQNCSGLTSFTIPSSVTSIGNNAFSGCFGLTSIIIPNSVTSIGQNAFFGCFGLTSITIPNSVTSIGLGAFNGCSSLTSITIPNSLTFIAQAAFTGCSGLTSITIPNSVGHIRSYAFSGCSGLTSITIGSEVGRIESQAFACCQELLDVFCYAETVPSTETDAFDSSYPEYATLHVPEVAYESYRTTEPWSNFGTIKVIDGETPIVEKCATPTITYANGKVRFSCETEGVEFVPSITVTPNQLQNGNELAIGGTFTVSVYAVKEGYDNSDTATITINMSQIGDVNADGELNAADITAVVNAILGK